MPPPAFRLAWCLPLSPCNVESALDRYRTGDNDCDLLEPAGPAVNTYSRDFAMSNATFVAWGGGVAENFATGLSAMIFPS